MMQLKRELASTQEKIEKLRKENVLIQQEIQLLKKPASFNVERIAREELMMGKTNETVYLFVPYSSHPGNKTYKK